MHQCHLLTRIIINVLRVFSSPKSSPSCVHSASGPWRLAQKSGNNELFTLQLSILFGWWEGQLRELEAGVLPGGPVVKILSFQCKGVQIRSLVRELRSHMQCSMAKKIKILKKKWWERAGGRRKSKGQMFILLVPLCQVAMVVCNPLFLGTYNYSLSSPLQAGQGEVKAPYCCQPQGCAIFYCVFLNPTHTFVNILFILFTSIYPIWVCHLFSASILTNRMSSAL